MTLRKWFSFYVGICSLMAILLFQIPEARAVVGQAEGYDEFRQTDLSEFQQAIVREEQMDRMARDLEMNALIDQQGGSPIKTSLTGDDLKELEELKRQLLSIPKRDRIRFSVEGQVLYDSNIKRLVPRQEKGDTIFDQRAGVQFDLSGRKTDLRFETSYGKQWNINFSESDFLLLESRLRYRKKYFKKLTHSTQYRLARTSNKTIEIDEKKIRYDINQSWSFNYPFSRKLSLNNEVTTTKRLFPQEAFDQDSYWEATAAPNAFWQLTPKSRISMGYTFGANRIRTKTGDSNTHNIQIGYFGRVTKKSSMSLDLAYSYQSPRSRDTQTVKTVTAGIGYIWQATPKTQLTVQLIRSIQNSTSNFVSGEVDGLNSVSKLDNHFNNDSLSLSMNSRLNRKLNAVVNFTISHYRAVTEPIPNEKEEERQFSFPVSVQLNYTLFKWLSSYISYSFNFRTGDEKDETYRGHTWTAGMRLTF